jgi:hypothetical protein
MTLVLYSVIASKAKQSLSYNWDCHTLSGFAMTLVLYSVIASKAKQSLSYNRDCHALSGFCNDFSALFRHCEQSQAISFV